MKLTVSRILCLAMSVSVAALVFAACGPSKTAPGKSDVAPVSTPQPPLAPTPQAVPAPTKAAPLAPAPVPASAPKATPETPKAAPAVVASAPAKEPVHLPNGSFELVDKKGAVEFWAPDDPKAGRDTKAHSGEYSMKLHPSTKKNVTRRLRCSIFNGETLLGKHITIKAMTTAKLRPKANPKDPMPFAMHVQYVVNGKEEEFYHLFGGGKDWSEAIVSGVIPANADPRSLRLVITVRPTAVDPVLVDDVTLTVD